MSGYSVSKYSAEKEVFRGAAEGLNCSIVNPCLVFGPGNWHRSSLTLLKAGSKGLRLYPSGANAMVDARDVSTIVLKLLDSEESGEKYLVIGHNISFKSLFTHISKAFNKPAPQKKLNKFLANASAFTLLRTFIEFLEKGALFLLKVYNLHTKPLNILMKKSKTGLTIIFIPSKTPSKML